MQKITLYRYNRPEGGVTVSPVKPNGEHTELYRLIADDGCTLTDGVNYVGCVDTDNPQAWTEVLDGADPNEPTAEDYETALAEMGVQV